MSSDMEIEKEIQAKGLNAPRLNPGYIESRILSEHFIVAGHVVVPTAPESATTRNALNCLTMCVLVLENGYTVVGKSACASPENFDAELGRKIARKNAVEQIWALEGYLLRQNLAEANRGPAEPVGASEASGV